MSRDPFQNMSKEDFEALVDELKDKEPVWTSFDPRAGGSDGTDWDKISMKLHDLYRAGVIPSEFFRGQAQPDTATSMRDKMDLHEEAMNRLLHQERAYRPVMTQQRAREAYFATLEFRCGECKKLVPATKAYREIKPTMLYDYAYYFHVRQGTGRKVYEEVSCGPMILEVS